jgi:hypothetical protein
MTNVVFPEIILLETLKSALMFVRKDYEDAIDKTKSYLYLMLNGRVLDKYNLFANAEKVICGAIDDPRTFEIDLMFNKDRQGAPTAHITLPQEIGQNGGIGSDEGYGEEYYQDLEENLENTPEDEVNDHWRATYSRRMQSTYHIVITSDNTNEVILLYHFLKNLLIACVPHLHIKGLQNITFGGRDIEPYADLSNYLYMRAVALTLEYDTFVPTIHANKMFDLEAEGTAAES